MVTTKAVQGSLPGIHKNQHGEEAMTTTEKNLSAVAEDLRSERVFDVEAHPTMTFASTAVEDRGDGSLSIVGDLTIHGITRRVTLETEFLGLDETGLQGEPRIGFSARTTVRRSEFGVGERSVEGSKVIVGDAVTVELDVEAHPEAEGQS